MALRLSEITPGFGVTIEGWSADADLDDATVGQLRDTFDEYQVLVFRNLDISPDAQQYLCGLLVGDEPPIDRASSVSNTHLYSTRISNRDDDGNAPYGRLLFHADGMWSESPQELLSLYGEKVEPPSVPTVFVSAVRSVGTLVRRPPGARRRPPRGSRHGPARPRWLRRG